MGGASSHASVGHGAVYASLVPRPLPVGRGLGTRLGVCMRLRAPESYNSRLRGK